MWQLSDLAPLLSDHDGWEVDVQGQALLIHNEDNIEAFLAVSGEQILVEVLLFDAGQVKDTDALNREILRTHKMFPLSTIGINAINGNDYYVAFGSLSSQSKAESVVIEVATLFRNVEAFIDLYQDFLKEQTA
ncbi:YjfI family protein [Photobacterium sp. WH77]|uniref:DUF2170 family protein n=1 Tax=Photobacterium arenosum TaxID=2774143 RepID=A0ABR9BTP1_9GAMM|nr:MULTISPECIES: DUF2170 family protein [Photobacterium]MBD8515136.1 DUF2170 family protein [Photobacterium arenosum]MCG2838077.1 YjfI family protein [Photobacterium sp. WH77]MCG2845695.1 YjfI family protein [Photobacterium sp. WH80]MDO6582814.1 DUF2170 family protein [Photobacterium sp. 2_MG-2023]